MALLQIAGKNFDGGFQSDTARDLLGQNISFRMKDWIPENEAPLRKRGGFMWASPNLNALASTPHLAAVGWFPVSGDPHLVEIGSSGQVFKQAQFDGVSGTTLIGASGLGPTHRPIWHKDRGIILPGLSGAASNVKKYYPSGGSYALADLGGTPPQARVGESWGDYLILANGYVGGTLFEKRLWFSDVGNPEAWQTGVSFFDMPAEVLQVRWLHNILVVWGYDHTWVLTGDTPPGLGGNLANSNAYNEGTFDGRTVAIYRNYAVWANPSGIWKSDGATLTDLTEQAGISIFWRALCSTFSFKQGWSAAGGVIKNVYKVSVSNAAGVHLTTVCLDLEKNIAWEESNIDAAMYAARDAGPGTSLADGHEELFFAHRSQPYAGSLSSLWTPSAANAYDADGAAVLPSIELPFYKFYTFFHRRIMPSAELQRFRALWVDYDLRALPGIDTHLNVGFALSPELQTYEASPDTLPARTVQGRGKAAIKRLSTGLSCKLSQVGPSSDTRLYQTQIEGWPLESGRK